jgi:hypothetical protein
MGTWGSWIKQFFIFLMIVFHLMEFKHGFNMNNEQFKIKKEVIMIKQTTKTDTYVSKNYPTPKRH